MGDQSQNTLGEYLRMLRRSRWLILLAVVLCVGVALAYSLTQEKTYQATAQLTVRDTSQDLIELGEAGGSTRLPIAVATEHLPEVTRGEVMRAVRRELDIDGSIDDLRDLVSVEVDPNSNALLVTVESESAAEAARLANAIALADARITTDADRTTYRQRAADLEDQLNDQDIEENPAAAALAYDTLSTLQALATTAEPVQVSSGAQVPNSPSSPKTSRNVVAAGVIGLLLGFALAFGRARLDRRLREPGDAEAIFEDPVLVRLRPDVFAHTGSQADAEHKGIGPLEPADAESIRMLRENVRYLAVDRSLRTIAVTSAIPEEGKSTVAACLAMAYASSGTRTLLVECDLRRRVLAGRFGIAEAPGLSDYLVGRADPAQVLQSIPAQPSGMNGGEPPALTCITAGSAPPRPADLLSSARFAEFVAKVGKVYDQVVIDCPPLLPVADTLEIVPNVECVLMCVRLNRTTVDQATGAREALKRMPARPTGLVITDFSERRGGAYYRDYYSYRADSAAPAATAAQPAAAAAQPQNDH